MNNIPYFLSHLPIWKANVKDTVKIKKVLVLKNINSMRLIKSPRT